MRRTGRYGCKKNTKQQIHPSPNITTMRARIATRLPAGRLQTNHQKREKLSFYRIYIQDNPRNLKKT